jgi:hypothetical protein
MILRSKWRGALGLFGLLAMVFLGGFRAQAQEMTAEKLMEQHLNSIAAKDKRDAIKNRMAVGTSLFQSKLPLKQAGGKAVVASDNDNLMFITSFNSQEYPFEKIGYFNKNINLPFVTAGSRSPLGAFIADHERVLSDGLFTGAISGVWPLMDPSSVRDRVKYGGTKKVGDRKAYVLEYFPKNTGSSEFSLRLYFDAENFRHLRSEYRDQINPKQDTFGTLGRQAGVTIKLTEDFTDFRTVDGVTLPYSYSANYLTDSNSGVFEYTWTIKIQQYLLNQNLAPGFFSFDQK